MKLEIETPTHLVDVNRLPLAAIEPTRRRRPAHRRAGAQQPIWPPTRACARDYPVLSRALLAGASAQLRNKATTGGNLLQRTRCAYFYDTAQALQQARARRRAARRSAASTACTRCSAPATHCIATHPSDMAVAMRALDATVETLMPDGATRVDPDRRLPPPARRHAADRDRAAARRADHRRDAAAAARRACRSTARCATAPPTPSRWSRWPPWSMPSRAAGSAAAVWPSAAWRTSRGECAEAEAALVDGQGLPPSRWRPTPCCGARAASAQRFQDPADAPHAARPSWPRPARPREDFP